MKGTSILIMKPQKRIFLVLSVLPCVARRQISFIFYDIIQSENYRAEYGVF